MISTESQKCMQVLSNAKILTLAKFKAFADNKFSVAKTMISVFDPVENIVGQGENAGYHGWRLVTSIFSFSHDVFKSFLFQGH